MDIAILVLLSFTALLLLFSLGLLLWRGKKNKGPSFSGDQDLARLSEDIAALKHSLPLLLKNNSLEAAAELQKLVKQTSEDDAKRLSFFEAQLREEVARLSENNTKRLLEFQSALTNSLKASLDSIHKKVDDNLASLQRKVDESLLNGFKGTSESMEKLQKALGEIDSAQKNISSLSAEVLSLKGVLTNAQQRGRYGEMQLEMILESMFGETYKGELYDFQYPLAKGDEGMRPDAVVFLDGAEKKQIMAIDAKFSLVGYEQLFGSSSLSEGEAEALKKRFMDALLTSIKQVARYASSGKIVRPAILFIPNDGIFAYVQSECLEVVEKARQQSVLLASPTILQPIVASFRVVQLDAKRTKNLEKINKALEGLGQEFKRFSSRWEKIERSVGTLGRATEDFAKTVRKMDNKFASISSSEIPDEQRLEERESDYETLEENSLESHVV